MCIGKGLKPVATNSEPLWGSSKNAKLPTPLPTAFVNCQLLIYAEFLAALIIPNMLLMISLR
jgi:hypothetical protein